MFTGLITHIAKINKIENYQNKDLKLTLKLEKNKVCHISKIGASIACNGICLTLIDFANDQEYLYYSFDVSEETLSKTNILSWKEEDPINLEFSLKIGDEMGGHLVSGHIDGLVKIKDISVNKDSYIFTFAISNELQKFIISKGSVTLNGISLTINDIIHKESDYFFTVNIISHTFNNTNLQFAKIDDLVNIEIDMISKYVNRLTTNDL